MGRRAIEGALIVLRPMMNELACVGSFTSAADFFRWCENHGGERVSPEGPNVFD